LNKWNLAIRDFDGMADSSRVNPLDDPECAAVYGRRPNGSRVWFRREDASNASKRAFQATGAQLSVFALDKPNSRKSGAKTYYSMTLTEYLDKLKTLPKEQWCFYEVTVPDRCCNVYLDCEADLTLNPRFDGTAAVEGIAHLFTKWLSKNVCPRFGSMDTFCWEVLDSSSRDKWSVHFIGIGEGMKNTLHVGAAVRRFEQYCVDKFGMDNNEWFIYKKHKLNPEPHRVFIIDNGIYTDNRVYRMIYQRKFGSTRVLIPEQDIEVPETLCMRELYYSMVQPPYLERTIESGHCAHECKELDGSEPVSMTNAGGSCSRAMIQARQSSSSGITTRSRSRAVESSSGAGRKRCPIELFAFAQRAVLALLGRHARDHNSAGFYPDELIVTVAVDDAWCNIKQDDHHAEGVPQTHSYYCVNLSTKEIHQKCFSAWCINQLKDHRVRARVRWPFTTALIKDADALLD
jgi:hypothetical protein